jgi:hypothetical protein
VPTPAPTPTPDQVSGLSATYYDNEDFSGQSVSRIDPQIKFNWGKKPPVTGFGADFWSARWTGYLQAQYSQTYTFHVRANDGVRFWVDGQLLIDQWKVQKITKHTGNIALVAGQKYEIKLEYFDATGAAVLDLSWSSTSTLRQVVPQARLSTTPPSAPLITNSAGLPAVYNGISGLNVSGFDPFVNFRTHQLQTLSMTGQYSPTYLQGIYTRLRNEARLHQQKRVMYLVPPLSHATVAIPAPPLGKTSTMSDHWFRRYLPRGPSTA